MRKSLKIFVTFLLLSCLSLAISEAQAQLKFDIAKGGGKTIIWVQQIKSKCDKAIEYVTNSQLGQFVGDGIKYTKEAISFATTKYDEMMTLYNKTKDAVLNSKEYKMAMISKEIAEKTFELKNMQEEKKQKLEDLKVEEELLKEQAQGKIESINANVEANKQMMIDEEEESGGISEENALFMEEQDAALEQVKRELDLALEDLEIQARLIEEEFVEKIKAQAEEIAELTKQLAELAESDKDKDKEKEKVSPQKHIQNFQDKLFLKSGETLSLKVEAKKRKERRKKANEDTDALLTMGTKTKSKKSKASGKLSMKKGIGETMSGESEVSGANVEVIAEQPSILLTYIRMNLADIQYQAMVELNMISDFNGQPVKEKFNLCDYTNGENRKSQLEMVKEKTAKTMEDAQSQFNKAKDFAAGVKDKVEDAKGAIEGAKGALEDVKGAVGDLKGAAEQVTNAVKEGGGDALQGMF